MTRSTQGPKRKEDQILDKFQRNMPESRSSLNKFSDAKSQVTSAMLFNNQQPISVGV